MVEKRRHPRFVPQDTAFAGEAPQLGEIIDISMGGVLFQYVDLPSPTPESGRFVICDDEGWCLANVPVETVDDFLVGRGSSFSQVAARRRRVRFGSLNAAQRWALERFIARHCG